MSRVAHSEPGLPMAERATDCSTETSIKVICIKHGGRIAFSKREDSIRSLANIAVDVIVLLHG